MYHFELAELVAEQSSHVENHVAKLNLFLLQRI